MYTVYPYMYLDWLDITHFSHQIDVTLKNIVEKAFRPLAAFLLALCVMLQTFINLIEPFLLDSLTLKHLLFQCYDESRGDYIIMLQKG